MKIELGDIVTRAELATWKEMSTIDDEPRVYATMIARWQQNLDTAIANRDKHLAQHKSNKQFDTVVLTFIFCFVTVMVSALLGANYFSKNYEQQYQKNIQSGLMPFGIRQGNNQIKDAPSGVTIESMECQKTADSHKRNLVYTLNLPKLSGDKVYAITHEVIKDSQVIGTGLFYTTPGAYGPTRFEKITPIDNPGSDFDWLRVNVRVVDAGSVIAKQ